MGVGLPSTKSAILLLRVPTVAVNRQKGLKTCQWQLEYKQEIRLAPFKGDGGGVGGVGC